MKRIYFLISLTFINVFCIKAQSSERTSIRVGLPDASTRKFFIQHPDVDSLVIRHEKNKPVWGGIYDARKDSDKKFESYFLDFEGDVYRFNKKYPELKNLKSADLLIGSVSGKKYLPDSVVYYDLSMTLRRDSTFYDFSYYIYPGKIYPGPPTKGGRAALKGNTTELQKEFTRAYKSWKPIEIPDSVLFFKGIVEVNGALGTIKLESGTQSQFSEKALEFIKREAASWWPANTGRRIQYLATFFVRLNNDESITFDAL